MRKASKYHLAGFSNPNDIGAIIRAKYIVINGIKVDKDYANFVPETFGRLTTIGPKFILRGANRTTRSYQVCQCDCGSIGVVASDKLVNGETKSCGCLQREAAKKCNTRHGKSKTSEHTTWCSLIDRCYSPNNDRYTDWGGRGIRVCDRWLKPNGQGFINFLADMGPRPGPEYTIERKDVNGNYCPENCIWLPGKLQGRNKRNSKTLTYNGKTQCIAAWAEELGVPSGRLYRRTYRGWSDKETIEGKERKSSK